MMKIDIHIHCAERSKCSHVTEREIIEEAIASGLDAIAFADHHRHVPPAHLAELRAAYPQIQIYSAIEMTVPERGSYLGEDILLVGVHDPILEERPTWSYEELYHMTKARDGYLQLCHPMRYHDEITIDVDQYPPDAIEIGSTNIGRDDHPAIAAFIRAHGSRAMHASDAHYPFHIGMFHVIMEEDFHSEQELIRLLRAGRYTLGVLEDKREAFNAKVAVREELAHALIAEGKDGADFERLTGQWRGYFDRVARGKTYMV